MQVQLIKDDNFIGLMDLLGALAARYIKKI